MNIWGFHKDSDSTCPKLASSSDFPKKLMNCSHFLTSCNRAQAEVPMERWCISLEDLKQFKRLVSQAVSDGRISPTESLGLHLDINHLTF